jgi:hypothetical protein
MSVDDGDALRHGLSSLISGPVMDLLCGIRASVRSSRIPAASPANMIWVKEAPGPAG